MYAPLVKSARRIRRYRLGAYRASLFDTLESAGEVQYLYVLAISGDDVPQPILYVASEVNAMAHRFGGSHFLGVFTDDGHTNMGASDEWADLERFAAKALQLAAEHLGVTAPPEEVQ